MAQIAVEQFLRLHASPRSQPSIILPESQRLVLHLHQLDERRNIKSLMDEVKVSALRSIPCELNGKIIGKGIPGLFFSEDLFLQDRDGFIMLDYRQPLRFLAFIFGWVKAEKLIGKYGKATGWYHRSPRPSRLAFQGRW